MPKMLLRQRRWKTSIILLILLGVFHVSLAQILVGTTVDEYRRNLTSFVIELHFQMGRSRWNMDEALPNLAPTHSTLYNRPVTIKEETEKRPVNPVKLTKKLEIPSDVLTSRGLTRRQLEQQQNTSTAVQPPWRSRDETADEKRARKHAVRKMRKERREQKTAMKTVFRNEKLKHDQELINVQHNLQGVNIV